MVPKPQTLTAILPSSGFPYPKPTFHRFVETRKCVIGKNNSYEFVFMCEETLAERRWGVVKIVDAAETVN